MTRPPQAPTPGVQLQSQILIQQQEQHQASQQAIPQGHQAYSWVPPNQQSSLQPLARAFVLPSLSPLPADHLQSFPPKDANGRLPCPYCPGTYLKQHFKRHVKTHTDPRLHICEFCNTRFGESDILKTHSRRCRNNPTRAGHLSNSDAHMMFSQLVEKAVTASHAGVAKPQKTVMATPNVKVNAFPGRLNEQYMNPKFGTFKWVQPWNELDKRTTPAELLTNHSHLPIVMSRKETAGQYVAPPKNVEQMHIEVQISRTNTCSPARRSSSHPDSFSESGCPQPEKELIKSRSATPSAGGVAARIVRSTPFLQDREDEMVTTEEVQETQASTQSTYDSYLYGVTYPDEESFSYIEL